MQDREQPELVKVGVTTRPSRERKAAIVHTMAAGAPLRQVLALDLAHARSVETVAHRRLGRSHHRSERGREWYHAAHDVKRLARRQGAWNRDDDEDAYRWCLTASGPIRTPLFRPATAWEYGRSPSRAEAIPR